MNNPYEEMESTLENTLSPDIIIYLLSRGGEGLPEEALRRRLHSMLRIIVSRGIYFTTSVKGNRSASTGCLFENLFANLSSYNAVRCRADSRSIYKYMLEHDWFPNPL